MAGECYDLVITGIRDSDAPDLVVKRLSSLCQTDNRLPEHEIREALFLNKKARIQYNFAYKEATQKKAMLEQCGLLCSLEPVLTLVAMETETPKYTCQACGHVQEKSGNDTDICDQCGVVGSKYHVKESRDKLVELEKSHINTLQKYREEGLTKEEERKFREQEREKIRRQLGVHSTTPAKRIVIGASITLSTVAALALTYFITPNEKSGQEQAQMDQMQRAPSVSMMAGSLPDEPVNGLQIDQVPSGYADTVVAKAPIGAETVAGQPSVEQAIEAADGIEDAATRAEMLSTIASGQAKTGNSNSSEEAFAYALETLKAAKDDAQRHAILETIARARVDAGNFDKALDLALKIDNPYQRSKVLIDIAQAQFAAQDWKAAEQTLARITQDSVAITNSGEKAQILSAVAKLHAMVGNKTAVNDNFSLALQHATRIEDHSLRVSVFCTIAKDQLESGDREASRQTIAGAEKVAAGLAQDVKSHTEALHAIAVTRASLGDFHHAKVTSERIKDAYMRAQTLKEVAEHEVVTGSADDAKRTLMRAIEATRNIPDVEQRMDALNAITAVQFKAAEG